MVNLNKQHMGIYQVKVVENVLKNLERVVGLIVYGKKQAKNLKTLLVLKCTL